MRKFKKRNVSGMSRKAPNRHILVWLMSDNSRNTTVWVMHMQMGKLWRRHPIVVNYPVQPGPDCVIPHTSCSFLHILLCGKKHTATALCVIFGGDVLQMLDFSVTLYPTLSLLNLSAVKLLCGVSPCASFMRPGENLVARWWHPSPQGSAEGSCPQ